MKRIAFSCLLALSLLSATPRLADAKAAYCAAALRACTADCREMYGSIPYLGQACATGCNIGYLFC